MHPSAKDQIIEYLKEFEWLVPWMYLDSIGKVTTGIGILLDPYEKYGRVLSWYDKDNPSRRAGDDEVEAEFRLVKSKVGPDGKPLKSKNPKENFAHFRAFEEITKLRATHEDIIKAVYGIVAEKESACRSYFGPDYDGFPADVQVALTQMSYAGGLLARRHELAPFLAARDWLGAQEFLYLTNPKQGKNGYRKYNACFRALMVNAHIVEGCSRLDPPNATMPRDIKIFFGFKNALSVARWDSTEDVDPTIRPDDVITSSNILPSLNRQL